MRATSLIILILSTSSAAVAADGAHPVPMWAEDFENGLAGWSAPASVGMSLFAIDAIEMRAIHGGMG